jgi:hypothetical protein
VRADVMEVLGGGWRSLVGGEQHEGRCPVGSERWLVWRADPQSMTTRRCMKRQQRLPAAALGAWDRGAR